MNCKNCGLEIVRQRNRWVHTFNNDESCFSVAEPEEDD